jgi:hypothetical protein
MPFSHASKVFNGIIRLCMRDMVPCVYRILDLKAEEVDQVRKKCKLPNEGSHWKALKVPIKSYLDDMLNVSTLSPFAEPSGRLQPI